MHPPVRNIRFASISASRPWLYIFIYFIFVLSWKNLGIWWFAWQILHAGWSWGGGLYDLSIPNSQEMRKQKKPASGWKCCWPSTICSWPSTLGSWGVKMYSNNLCRIDEHTIVFMLAITWRLLQYHRGLLNLLRFVPQITQLARTTYPSSRASQCLCHLHWGSQRASSSSRGPGTKTQVEYRYVGVIDSWCHESGSEKSLGTKMYRALQGMGIFVFISLPRNLFDLFAHGIGADTRGSATWGASLIL